jgi:hypothetical protein
MTVQGAVEIMRGYGLDPWRYDFICRDEIIRKIKVMQTEIVQGTEEVEVAYSEIDIRDGIPTQVQTPYRAAAQGDDGRGDQRGW